MGPLKRGVWMEEVTRVGPELVAAETLALQGWNTEAAAS